MTERRWTRQRFDQRVAERKAESKVRGGTEEGREATFVHAAAADMAADYEAALAAKDAEIAALANQLKRCLDGLAPDDAEAVPEEVHGLHAEVVGLRANLEKMAAFLTVTEDEIDAVRTEYRALWDAVVTYCNAAEESSNVEYAALVAMVMKSRFWSESIEERKEV